MKRGIVVGSLVGLLAACGGEDAGSANAPLPTAAPSPPPSPAPAPPPAAPSPPSSTPAPSPAATDRIIFSANGSQLFESDGRYVGAQDGVTVRLDAASGQYLVTTPADTTPEPLLRDARFVPNAGDPWTNFVLRTGLFFIIRASGSFPDGPARYIHSNLVAWGDAPPSEFSGHTAIGVPTPAGALPQQGVVAYTGLLEGKSTERGQIEGEVYSEVVQGVISFSFDFASGTASYSLSQLQLIGSGRPLPPVGSSPLVWTRGAVQFHQAVPGAPQSLAFPLSGRFAGPSGEELIGGLQFKYVSPIDGSQQTVGAAFIAKRPTG